MLVHELCSYCHDWLSLQCAPTGWEMTTFFQKEREREKRSKEKRYFQVFVLCCKTNTLDARIVSNPPSTHTLFHMINLCNKKKRKKKTDNNSNKDLINNIGFAPLVLQEGVYFRILSGCIWRLTNNSKNIDGHLPAHSITQN